MELYRLAFSIDAMSHRATFAELGSDLAAKYALSDERKLLTVTETAGFSGVPLVGPGVSHGAWAIDFRYEGGDTNAQWLIGLAEMPVAGCAFNSRTVWSISSFSGFGYGINARGAESSNPITTKPSAGDVYSLRLDMDAGTCSVAVNGVDKGVIFRGLQGLTLWPAVFMYYAGDRMRILSVTCLTSVAAGLDAIARGDTEIEVGAPVNEAEAEAIARALERCTKTTRCILTGTVPPVGVARIAAAAVTVRGLTFVQRPGARACVKDALLVGPRGLYFVCR